MFLTSEYQKLQQQIAELQTKADALLASEKQTVIATINELIATFVITPKELRFAATPSPSAGSAVRTPRTHPTAGKTIAPRYRDAEGNTWSGRGLQPKWLREALAAGKTLESMRIAAG